MSEKIFYILVLLGLAIVAYCVFFTKEKPMSGQENYRVTKISVDPPTQNNYTTLAAALNNNVASPIDPTGLPKYRLEWTEALPGEGEYTVVYGCEVLQGGLSPQIITWFTESPEGENHTQRSTWDDVVAYIQEIDAAAH